MKKNEREPQLKEPKVLYVFEDKPQQAKQAWRWLWLKGVFDRLVSLMK